MDMKKILAISIILLFLGISVAPSINQSIVTASQDDDLIEVTTQACGIQGYKDTTVKLTREQYQSLEQYLVEFRARLNQTSTRDEAIPIFKEAVVELDKYGLLPRGMSVEKAQKLLVSLQYNPRMNILERKISNPVFSSNEIENYVCLIVGMSFHTYFVGFPLFPFKLFSMVIFGWWEDNLVYGWNPNPAVGWLLSIGLLGLKGVAGCFWGSILEWESLLFGYIGWDIGITGFTGLRLGLIGLGCFFYLGSAYHVKVNPANYPYAV